MPTIKDTKEQKPKGPRFASGGHYQAKDGEEIRFEKGEPVPADLTKAQIKSLKDNGLIED